MSLFNLDQSKETIWAMKYRPERIVDCVLPKANKAQFLGMLESGKIPNLLLSSTAPGSGKTTVALSLCKQLGYDVLFLNASLDNSIDDIRNTIIGFCSSVSLDSNPKCVLLDESDAMSQAGQAALRGVMEQFSNVSFILTCNYAQKLIEPIRSRCAHIEFKINDDERKELLKEYLKRVFFILTAEGVEFDKKAVIEFVQRYFPDFRKVLNELQRYSATGSIDLGVLSTTADSKVDGLIKAIKNREFSEARKWIGENAVDYATFYGKLYEEMYPQLDPSTIPPAILLLAKYQHMSATVVDQQLNLTACVLELMAEVSFK